MLGWLRDAPLESPTRRQRGVKLKLQARRGVRGINQENQNFGSG